MNQMNEEIKLKELEVQKINLQPGDVLMVTVKHEDIDYSSMQNLRKQLNLAFPDNKVMLFGMGNSGEVKLAVMSSEPVAPAPSLGYCGDCSCGKKERVEAERNG